MYHQPLTSPSNLPELRKSCCQNQEKKPALPVSVTTGQQQSTQTISYVRYDKPINGFTVTAEIEPYEEADWGPTTLTFSKGNISFSVYVDAFTKEGFSLKGYDASEEIVLQYLPKPKDVILYDKEPFCFTDIDYDGVDEILVLESGGGFTVLMLISFSRKTAHNGRTDLSRSLMSMLNSMPRIRPSRDITMKMQNLSEPI